MVKSVKKWFKYIARALYTRTHWEHNKILMLSDSTTAAAKWHKITLPQYDLDYICAKARRFLSWADQVAYTADWPLITNHLPGEFNSLAHLLSHVGDLLTAMYEIPPLVFPSGLKFSPHLSTRMANVFANHLATPLQTTHRLIPFCSTAPLHPDAMR